VEIITGILLGVLVAGKLVTLELEDATGKKQSVPFLRGKHSRRELAEYKGKEVDIEFEWGDSENRKLFRISLPGPTISL
jgi:hypothetical protein